MNSEQVKAIIASYWRYVRQCPVIALEVSHNLSAYADEERADVLAVDKDRFLIETEVKLTLADLRRDAKKLKHRDFREKQLRCVARYFYFAVPRAMSLNHLIPSLSCSRTPRISRPAASARSES
ncbi:unnamed protein product, partial [marine sediment metagenome]